MTRRIITAAASLLIPSALLLTPEQAAAQDVSASFRASYTFEHPTAGEIGPWKVRFTLYDDGTFLSDDGNGGEWELAGSSLTLWFVNEPVASAGQQFGAALWSGTFNGADVCNGSIVSWYPDAFGGATVLVEGEWHTKGCP